MDVRLGGGSDTPHLGVDVAGDANHSDRGLLVDCELTEIDDWHEADQVVVEARQNRKQRFTAAGGDRTDHGVRGDDEAGGRCRDVLGTAFGPREAGERLATERRGD